MKRFLIALLLCMAGTVAHAQNAEPPPGATNFWCSYGSGSNISMDQCVNKYVQLAAQQPSSGSVACAVNPPGTGYVTVLPTNVSWRITWQDQVPNHYMTLYISLVYTCPAGTTGGGIDNQPGGIVFQYSSTTPRVCQGGSVAYPNNPDSCYCPDKHTSTTTYHQYWSPDWSECFPSLWDVIHLQPNG